MESTNFEPAENMAIKKRKKIFFVIILIVLVCATAGLYFGCVNSERNTFQPRSLIIDELDMYDLFLDYLQASNVQRLIGYGEVDFFYVGHEVSMFVAHYIYDDLVNHQLVASTGRSVDKREFRGTAAFGITREENSLLGVRTMMPGQTWGNAVELPVDFQISMTYTPQTRRTSIERGQRYMLRVETAGSTFKEVGTWWFDPEILRINRETLILYIVFD